MNSLIKNTIIFTIGAAIGSVVTLKLIEDKYKKIAQEEIDSVKEVFSKKENAFEIKVEQDVETTTSISEKPDLGIYANVLKNKNYTNYNDYPSDDGEEVRDKVMNPRSRPYVIPPEDFGDEDDHDLYVYIYYADGILTDEGDEPLDEDDIEELVGAESLTTFGKYEEDTVFVRNEGLQMDIEILKNNAKYYHDERERKPHEVD